MSLVSAILLSAGESSRMGSLKALLPWQGSTLIQYQINALRDAGASEVVVVGGYKSDQILPSIENEPGVVVISNPNYYLGKTTSIKAGLENLSSQSNTILILAVDQPRPMMLLSKLISAHINSGKSITMPVFNGKSGHPILFSSSLMPELMNITEETEGLRAISRRYRDSMNLSDIDNGIVNADLNTPEDVESARQLFDQYG